ncbi:MAG: PilZ domain-containing protein [Dehalococcoidia bacterium]|nr:PilZ domain-containing protein [Dehalococcoidia bacterium]
MQSLPPRLDQLRAQGLTPGLSLQMHALLGVAPEMYRTRVEEVDTRGVGVLVPMRRLRARPLPWATPFRAYYVYRGTRRTFDTELTGSSEDCSLQYLALPACIQSVERRGLFRLETILPLSALRRVACTPEEQEEVSLLPEGATLVDLSEGGVGLRTSEAVLPGEILEVALTLPAAGELLARVRVLSTEEPPEGYSFRRLHCQFLGLTRADRDKVGRFLIRRQLEMRRSGRL